MKMGHNTTTERTKFVGDCAYSDWWLRFELESWGHSAGTEMLVSGQQDSTEFVFGKFGRDHEQPFLFLI